MTDIDHATEARAQLIDAEAYVGTNMLAQTGESKTDVLLAAQVHATLALVEQQRIANLIALHRHEVEYDIGGDRSCLYKPGTEDLRDDIREGLGL